jgi:uncharacterized protein YceK
MKAKYGLNKGLIVFVVLIISVLFFSGCGSLNYTKISKEFDLAKNLEIAKITGRRAMSDNAWKSTVANIKIDGKPCIFSHPDSSLSYMIAIPKEGNYVFRFSVGYHPAAKKWGVSDGVRMTVEITNGSGSKTVFDRYVMPKDKLFNVVIPLSDYSGKNIALTLYSLNDKEKNANGDWILWYEPKVISIK